MMRDRRVTLRGTPLLLRSADPRPALGATRPLPFAHRVHAAPILLGASCEVLELHALDRPRRWRRLPRIHIGRCGSLANPHAPRLIERREKALDGGTRSAQRGPRWRDWRL